jgi:hypothetical protein
VGILSILMDILGTYKIAIIKITSPFMKKKALDKQYHHGQIGTYSNKSLCTQLDLQESTFDPTTFYKNDI